MSIEFLKQREMDKKVWSREGGKINTEMCFEVVTTWGSRNVLRKLLKWKSELFLWEKNREALCYQFPEPNGQQKPMPGGYDGVREDPRKKIRNRVERFQVAQAKSCLKCMQSSWLEQWWRTRQVRAPRWSWRALEENTGIWYIDLFKHCGANVQKNANVHTQKPTHTHTWAQMICISLSSIFEHYYVLRNKTCV